MFYKVQSLHSDSKGVWATWRDVLDDYESASVEYNRLKLEYPQWTFRLVECKVLED